MSRYWIVPLFVVTLLIVALVAPAALGAHTGHMHKALGTIAVVHDQHIGIKTTDGKTVTVVVNDKTTVTRGKEKLDATALKVGERISVDYMEENKVMTAHAFKLATTTAAKK